MALVPFTHVLRRKTETGFTFNKGVLVEGVGFVMLRPKPIETYSGSNLYVIRDLSGCDLLTYTDIKRPPR
jgi:hypothetical protein